MRKLISILVIATFVVVACKKIELSENNSNGGSNASNNHNNLMRIINGYEMAGQKHNEALDSVAFHQDFPNISSGTADSIIYNFFVTLYEHNNIPSLNYIYNIIDTYNSYSIADIADEYFNNDKITEDVYHLIKSVEHILDSSSNLSHLTDLINSYQNYVKSKSDEFSDEESGFLLGASSIAKYSGVYWDNARTLSGNPWGFNDTTYAGILDRIRADIKGFITGWRDDYCNGNLQCQWDAATYSATIHSRAN
jgi:hypothetical protein